MPARTAPVLVKRIRHLRRQGLQIGAIAREVGVGRGTVAKYVGKVDDQAELEDVVGGLTAAQRDNLMRLVELPVAQVELLAKEIRGHRCDCGADIAYMASTTWICCQDCGERYSPAPPQPKAAKQPPPAAERRATQRAIMRPSRHAGRRGRG